MQNKFHENCFYTKPISGALELSKIYKSLILETNLDLVTNGGSGVAGHICKRKIECD